MNGSYGYLKKEVTDDNEIETDKELRKIKKKLRHLKQKGDLEGSRKLDILINEYENLNKPVEINKPNKAKANKANKAKANKDSDGFLEKEYQKNKDRNAKKYAEQKIREEWEKEQKKKAEGEKRDRNREREREYKLILQMSDAERIIHNHGLKKTNLPHDILEIISDYSHKLWKKLSLKYHPDKYEGKDTYSKLLNCLKDDLDH